MSSCDYCKISGRITSDDEINRSSHLAAFKTLFTISCYIRKLYPKRASALDFKDAVTLIFGHNDVVFDLFIEARFLPSITLLPNFSKLFQFFRYHCTKIFRLNVKSTANSVNQAFQLMIDMRYLIMFVTEKRQKLHRYDQMTEQRHL